VSQPRTRQDPLRKRMILSVLVRADALRQGDFVDFGTKAVPPRIWCVGSVQRCLDGVEIQWVHAIPGKGARSWSGRYGLGDLMHRVPSAVIDRLVA
jgi:hypothetical protein